MRQWFRAVSPPVWTIVVFAIGYIAAEAVVLFVWNLTSEVREIAIPRDALLIVAAIVYGIIRCYSFHPCFSRDYRQWLATTPWDGTAADLPRHVELKLQDVAVVSVLMLLGWHHAAFSPLRLPMFLLFGYLTCAAISLGKAKLWNYCYLIAFGLGLVVLLIPNIVASSSVAFLLYCVAASGIQTSLKQMPHDELWPDQNVAWSIPVTTSKQSNQKLLGWPYDGIGPDDQCVKISIRHAETISLIAGWWIVVIMFACAFVTKAREPGRSVQSLLADSLEFSQLLFVAVLISAMIRIGTYGANHRPPISLWGRLWTGRWIIPKYDVAFVSPALAVACYWGIILGLGVLFQFSPIIVLPLAIAGASLCLLGLGPSLKEWKLTAPCRIVKTRTIAQR